ncbi:MAG: nucleotidyltransferase domain-containing protein [Deltaproteobacteria bacterium]|nr:nucleotidyltransferase domain-containing protein [Deltaproteobacteria bacterium]
MEIGEVVDKISAVLQGFKEVEVAYLFGSYATGEARATSDVDIAILAPQLGLDRFCELWSCITIAAGTERIDLVTLDDKPALFRYEVIKEGRLIYCKNDETLNDFEMKSWQAYMDGKHIRGIYLNDFYAGLSRGI